MATKFDLILLTKYNIVNGILTLEGAIHPMLMAQEVVRSFSDKLQITRLYRVWFENLKLLTALPSEGIIPVIPEILAIEISFQFVMIFADFGKGYLNIALDLREGQLTLSKGYETYAWIEKATREDLQAVCDAVAERFEESKTELMEWTEKLKEYKQ